MNDRDDSLMVVNGRLVFENYDALSQTIKAISSFSVTDLQDWEKNKLDGYLSMRGRYERLTDVERLSISEKLSNDGFEEILTLVEDTDGEIEARLNAGTITLATLFNEHGILQIGDEVIKLEFDKSKIVKYKSEQQLLELHATKWKELPKEARIYQVSQSTVSMNTGKTAARVGTCEARYGRDKRFKGELWISNTPPIYSGTGARSKHQNRFLRVWWADNAPQLRLVVNGTFTQALVGGSTVSETISYDSQVRFNDNLVEYVWNECFNVSCLFDASATVTTSGVGDDNAPRNCTIF